MVDELDGSGTAVARYAQGLGIDEPLAMYRGGASYYYNADGLGSITSLTNSSGQIAATYTYDSFGKLTASTGTLTNPFRYTGREYGSDTGLYYYRARYYDSNVGRFISEDPISFGGGANFYSYVYNDPADLVDPSGNDPCVNINDFVKALDKNASKNESSTGWCGQYLGKALKAGGADVGSHAGKDYGPYLRKHGFSEVSQTNYQPQIGDVAVIQPYPGGSAGGHAEAWNGKQWVSDFPQNYFPKTPGHGVYPGPEYRKNQPSYDIYRPTPCPSSSPAEQSVYQQVVSWIEQWFD